jgi:hypothetical protein
VESRLLFASSTPRLFVVHELEVTNTNFNRKQAFRNLNSVVVPAFVSVPKSDKEEKTGS